MILASKKYLKELINARRYRAGIYSAQESK